MGGVFVCYRRDDSAGWAGRLADTLTRSLGDGMVFIDVHGIELGVDFVEVIKDTLDSCSVTLVVIGQRWLAASERDLPNRLHEDEDLVAIEVATSLERDVRVIPVLVDGAEMPPSSDLPEGLRTLTRRNSIELSVTSFPQDCARLIDALRPLLEDEEPPGGPIEARRADDAAPAPARPAPPAADPDEASTQPDAEVVTPTPADLSAAGDPPAAAAVPPAPAPPTPDREVVGREQQVPAASVDATEGPAGSWGAAWDVAGEVAVDHLRRAALARDGSRLVVHDRLDDGSERLQVLDVETGDVAWRWTGDELRWGPVISADGSLVAVAGARSTDDEREVEVLAGDDGSRRHLLRGGPEPVAVPGGEPGFFASAGKFLVAATHNAITLWKLSKERKPRGVVSGVADPISVALPQRYTTYHMAILWATGSFTVQTPHGTVEAEAEVEVDGTTVVRMPARSSDDLIVVTPTTVSWRGDGHVLPHALSPHATQSAAFFPNGTIGELKDGAYGRLLVGTTVFEVAERELVHVYSPWVQPVGELVASTIAESSRLITVTSEADRVAVWRQAT